MIKLDKMDFLMKNTLILRIESAIKNKTSPSEAA